MDTPSIPKLHLPPWFHDGWAGLVTLNGWFAGGYVELSSNIFVKPFFITLDRIKSDMNSEIYWFDQDVIILRELTIDIIENLLPILEEKGAFSTMRKFESIVWDDETPPNTTPPMLTS